MRSFEGQFSDNRPLKRSPAEKKKLLAELKDTLANLKPQSAPSLRTTLTARIKELEAELAPVKR
jgi:ribosomal protein L29